jgi:acetyl-CoA carboxylase biotin carboxylase subunit
MFQKILIANRGEIAVRIIRTCKVLKIETVAVYSDVDVDSLHVQLADEAVCIGGAKSSDSYLNMENIIQAAINSGAEAIHPGFGFLSENAAFANLCEEVGLRFIGPKGSVIDKMGNKSTAIQMMIDHNIPVVPGSNGKVETPEIGLNISRKIGFPVLIKASAGGGGRGMRIALNENEFLNQFNTAKAEAKNAFGDDSMYIEKLVINPKHIEFQILADKYGKVIHLGERDCSIQRRNQKVIEEAPSMISENMRIEMGNAAIRAAQAVGYENAGTIEFLVDKDDFYFIEMNTRVQVEHPITEMITGVDIIEQQIRIASGEHMMIEQSDVVFDGHAIEVRINAENPEKGFQPAPGLINALHVPGGFGIRFDSFIYQGYTVSPFYDSMIGKMIVHAKDRGSAIDKMCAALDELVIGGIDTNQNFVHTLLHNSDYVKGDFNTGFIAAKLDRLLEHENHE